MPFPVSAVRNKILGVNYAYLAYDTFTRANGALGNTESAGPLGAAPALAWTGSTFAISGNAAKGTPVTLGGELITDGDMELAGVANWPAQGTPTTLDKSGVQKHAGAQSLRAINDAVTEGAYQLVSCVQGTWYKVVAWVYANASPRGNVNCNQAFFGATNTNVGFVNAASWGNIIAYAPAFTTGNGIIQLISRDAAGGTIYYDDVSVKALATAELVATVDVGTPNFDASVNVTIANSTAPSNNNHRWAGIVVSLDSIINPQNYIVAVISRVGYAVYKVVSGVMSEVFAFTAAGYTYGDGRTLRIVKNGTSVSLYYNGVQLSTTKTVSDVGIISNTKIGLFSCDSGNTLDTFFAVKP